MEKNSLNKAYIFIISIFAIGIAISNIISFFNGMGIALIGASLCLTLAIVNIVKDENIKNRFVDIFILLILEFAMLLILFFAYDFNLKGITNNFPLVMRNICAIYSLVAMCYVMFRYISELKGKKYTVLENMFNSDPLAKEKKVKLSKEQIRQNKELENGTFAPKPSSLNVANNSTETEQSSEEAVEVEPIEEIENVESETQTQEDDAKLIDAVEQAINNSESEQQNTESEPQDKPTTPTNRTNFWY